MRTYCILSREQIPSFSKVIAKVLVTILLAVLISPISGLADVVNLTPTKDTFIDQAAPAKKFGGWKQLKTRQEVTSKGFFGRPATTGGARETLLEFDLSGIPQDAEIAKAYLKLYSNKNKNFRKDNATRVYAVLEPWLQSTTWNGKPATASTYEDSIAVNGFGQYAQWDITNLVKDWVSGLEQNHGVVVRSEGGGELYFASKEAPDPGKRPVLYIEYANPGAGESLNVTVEANPTSGEAPLSVNFTANVPDGGTGMEYRWDFEGDGIVDEIGSSGETSFTYYDSGEFNATVEVFATSTATADASGSSYSTSGNGKGKGSTKVRVTGKPGTNQPPTLNLQASPSSGTSPLGVTFESNASDPDGYIVEYRWDTNGDGIVDEVTTSNPYTFIYITPGTYNVSVEVVDNGGMTASDNVTVTVSSSPEPTNQAPVLDLLSSPNSGEAPLSVKFESNAYDPDGTIVEYRWDYDGDGIVDEVTNSNPVTFTYYEEGTYNPSVKVLDNEGMEASDSVAVDVYPSSINETNGTPKVLEMAANTRTPSTSFIKNNRSFMETRNFRGTDIFIKYTRNDTSGKTFERSVFDPTYAIQPGDVQSAINDLVNANFVKFTDNFLAIWCSNDVDAINWYGSETYWNTILNNIGIAAKVARDAGLRGISLDCETYLYQNHWNYTTLEQKYPGYTSGTTLEKRNQWASQAKLRGKQIMQRMIQEYGSNFRLKFRNGLQYVRQIEEINKNHPLSQPGANKYELVPAFINGMLEGLSGNADIVEYAPPVFNFKKGIIRQSDFDEIHAILKPIDGYVVTHPEYIEPKNVAIYNAKYKMGFMVWLDDSDSPKFSWYDGTIWTNDPSLLNNNTWTPSSLRTWLQKCKDPKYSAVYCTIFVGKYEYNLPDWWKADAINQQYVDALNNEF